MWACTFCSFSANMSIEGLNFGKVQMRLSESSKLLSVFSRFKMFESFTIIFLTVSGIGFSYTFPPNGSLFSISSLKKFSSLANSAGRSEKLSLGASVIIQSAHMPSLRLSTTSLPLYGYSRIELKMVLSLSLVFSFPVG